MRGGLDDALEKLARRDELRRRATSEATGTPAAVTELVEAIAAVVGRNPRLGVTVGVEGEGDPIVLRFYYEDGQVQVAADTTLGARAAEGGPRHADFDVVVGEPVEESPPPHPGGETRRINPDDLDRYGPSEYSYEEPTYYVDSDTAERRYGSFDGPAPQYSAPDAGETSRDLGARMRDLGMASSSRDAAQAQQRQSEQAQFEQTQSEQAQFEQAPFERAPFEQTSFERAQFEPAPFERPRSEPAQAQRRPAPQAQHPQSPAPQYPPHPLAPTPPPSVPPQTTRRIEPERYRAPAEPPAYERMHGEWGSVTERLVPPPETRGMPTPLPKPIPLQVERPEETEVNARRLAALLRDDPSLLNQRPE